MEKEVGGVEEHRVSRRQFIKFIGSSTPAVKGAWERGNAAVFVQI